MSTSNESPVRAKFLKPGTKLLLKIGFGDEVYEITFVRREKPIIGNAINIFQCDRFRGLTGPDDTGICTMNDYNVAKKIKRKAPLGPT